MPCYLQYCLGKWCSQGEGRRAAVVFWEEYRALCSRAVQAVAQNSSDCAGDPRAHRDEGAVRLPCDLLRGMCEKLRSEVRMQKNIHISILINFLENNLKLSGFFGVQMFVHVHKNYFAAVRQLGKSRRKKTRWPFGLTAKNFRWARCAIWRC